MSAFADLRSAPAREVAPGVVVRGIHGEQESLALVEFAPGATVPEHQHANEQLGFVIEGSLDFEIAGERRTLGCGETWTIPGGVPHVASAGPDGAVIVEAFTPARTDWEKLAVLPDATHRWP